MSLIASKSASSHAPAPAGTHVARCVSMIDLGTTETTGQFGTKRQRKLRLSFELPEELHVFNEEKGEQPYMVHGEFTFSMHEKGKLRPFLETWRGAKFTDEEAHTFDIARLLGVPCLLNVMHNAGKNGGVYANIGGASRLTKGMTAPAQITRSTEFSLSTFDEDTYYSLPDWLQHKIGESDEYKAIVEANKKANAASAATAVMAGHGSQGDHEEGDDIPF